METLGGADMRVSWQTLSTFFVAVLAKKYTNPSSDIIEVLAGLDAIDTVFADFVGALDATIRNGRSCSCSGTLGAGPLWKRSADDSGGLDSGNSGKGSRGRLGGDIGSVPDDAADVLYPEGLVPFGDESKTGCASKSSGCHADRDSSSKMPTHRRG